MVTFQLTGLKIHVRVPWSTSWGQMKAGSDWCLFLPLGEESSELRGPKSLIYYNYMCVHIKISLRSVQVLQGM